MEDLLSAWTLHIQILEESFYKLNIIVNFHKNIY